MIFEKKVRKLTQTFGTDPQVPWIILILITAAFILIIYPGLIVTDQRYAPGDVAERDIKAPQDFLVEDTAATEANRRKAEDRVLTVYDYDPALAASISRTVRGAFSAVRGGGAAGAPPPPAPDLAEAPPAQPPAGETEPTGDGGVVRTEAIKARLEGGLAISMEDTLFNALAEAGFTERISEGVARIVSEVMEKGVVANKDLLLRESEKGIVLRTVGSGRERTVLDLDGFLSLDQARSAAKTLAHSASGGLDYTTRNLVIDLAQRLIQPNITLNRNETQERRRTEADEVKPVFHRIKAGEMLLREGERISEVQLLKIRALQAELKDRQVVETTLGAALLMVCLMITAYVLHPHAAGSRGRPANRDLLFVGAAIVFFLVIGEVSASLAEALATKAGMPISAATIAYVTPIASATMLICLFLGLPTALHTASILAVGMAVIYHGSFDILIFYLVSSAMAAFWVRNCRERSVFVKAGLQTGLLNIALITAISVYHAELSLPRLGWDWTFGLIGGFFSGVLAAGIAPLVEIAFGYSSDIKLLELSNLDQPLMRKLMIEAPGTYHHSVIVGSMVEAAAAEIGANPLLAKVCGYYHDIGKIRKPAYFIENQSGKNRHDKLAPSMSALILIAHIKDGVEMARQYKLGPVIADTITQHHGTSLIRFFYEKAKAIKGEENVKEDNYRYPGPKPQTREAGLVMLADVVEAASRTLENPIPSRIQGLVQNLTNQIFSDGQLDNCELTLKDLHSIAKVFIKILTGIHHHRVEYPERRSAANGKARQRDGNTDRQPAKPGGDRPAQAPEGDAGHLKRLGLS
jgi:putative nucleotidyltransferase with HDIG domain